MVNRRCLTMLFVLAAGHEVLAQRPVGVQHVVLSVSAADSRSQTSGLEVGIGDLIAVRATGLVTIGRFSRDVDAAGVPTGGIGRTGQVYLEYRIGGGLSRSAGVNGAHTAAEGGDLAFRIKDTQYDDNAGSFMVDVIVVPASSIPGAISPEGVASAPASEVIGYMQDFFKTFAVEQEAYFAEHARYAESVSALHAHVPLDISVERLTVTERGTGWSIIVRHGILPRLRCALAIGTPNPLDTAVTDAQPVCR